MKRHPASEGFQSWTGRLSYETLSRMETEALEENRTVAYILREILGRHFNLPKSEWHPPRVIPTGVKKNKRTA